MCIQQFWPKLEKKKVTKKRKADDSVVLSPRDSNKL